MANVTLYHTEGCHLCDQAAELLVSSPSVSDIEYVDIIVDERLIAQYQTSIPVVVKPSGEALYWPFDAQAIRQFMSVHNYKRIQ